MRELVGRSQRTGMDTIPVNHRLQSLRDAGKLSCGAALFNESYSVREGGWGGGGISKHTITDGDKPEAYFNYISLLIQN